MRVQHNIMAMSAYRNYTNNVNAMKKNLEKLSSGYKINRAGDDAAGLAISEKMRAQITGLETAQKNAKDGISLVQTAEGALTEVHDMLNRMVELATQSANGTYSDDVDREQLQKEIEQLQEEIDRISQSSNFNGINLLDGSLSQTTTPGKSIPGAAKAVTVTAVADGDHDGQDAVKGVYSFDIKDLVVSNGSTNVATITIAIGGQNLTSGGAVTISLTDSTVAATDIASKITVTAVKIGNITYTVSVNGTKITLSAKTAPTTTNEILTKVAANSKVTITVGSKDDKNNSFDLAVHADTPAKVFSPSKVAQGSFALTAAMLKDGQSIRIGKDIYTFAVGKDSEYTGVANVIDLTKLEEGDADLIHEASVLLSQQTNSMFDITTDGSTIYLTEKKDAVDYDEDWDLKGTAGSATDGTWNTAVGSTDTTTGVVSYQEKGTVTKTSTVGKGLTLQIGDTADDYNQITVGINKCDSASIGVGDIDISDQDGAQKAIDKIKDAINYVSDVRGTLGATQNRLEHTINNLSVMTENIQDAESTIRDTDIAEEMMAYTKNNILIQSAQAMLAQANQVPQGVLQLLQ